MAEAASAPASENQGELQAKLEKTQKALAERTRQAAILKGHVEKAKSHITKLAGALKEKRARGGGDGGAGLDISGFQKLVTEQRSTYEGDIELWKATEVAVSKSVQKLLGEATASPGLAKTIHPHLDKLRRILDAGRSIMNNTEQSVVEAEALVKKLGG
jgi:hypothetical protein